VFEEKRLCVIGKGINISNLHEWQSLFGIKEKAGFRVTPAGRGEKMRIKAAQEFCGFCTLLFGVETCALLNFINCIFVIASVSSVHSVRLAGLTMSANLQILNAAWSLLGIPIIVCAGCGAVYRIESHLRIYFYYLLASFFLASAMIISLLSTGNLCKGAVPDEIKQLGESFVCAITDTFLYFWLLIGGLIHVYFIYIVWSAAEEIHRACYPALLSYKEQLQNQSKLKSNNEGGGMPGMPFGGGGGGVQRGMPVAQGTNASTPATRPSMPMLAPGMGMPMAQGGMPIAGGGGHSAPGLRHTVIDSNSHAQPDYGATR